MLQERHFYSTNEIIEKIDIEPVEFIKSFYPLTLLRRIYLTFTIFSKKSLINHAASGAFYFLLSIVPLALFFVFVLDSWLSGYGKVSDYFFQLLSEINPEINKQFVENLGLLKGGSSIYGVVGILGLLWSARLVFTSIRNGFDVIFPSTHQRGLIKNNLVSLIFLPIIFIATLVFFLTGAVIKQLNKLINAFDLNNIIDLSFLESLTGFYPAILAVFIAFMLYRFIPNIKIKGTYALTGALLFIVVMYFTQKILGIFISWSKYHILYGVISAVIIALFWTYILFSLFYFFAVFIYVQSHYKELEFIKWYSAVNGNAGIIDKLLFYNSLSSMKSSQISLSKDEAVFLSGQKGGFIYLLLSGVVFLERDKKFISDIAVYSFFGESGVIGDDIYDSDAVCQVPGFALKLSKEFYNSVSAASPEISKNMLTAIIERKY